MTEATRLVLIRHPQIREDMRGRCCGRLDVGLSARGLRQARLIARTFSEIPIAAVYTSSLSRALETAAKLAEPHELEPVVFDDLREIDFGELEGLAFEEIAETRPDLYRRWMSAPTSVRFPGGESYAQLRLRALRASSEIRARHHGELTAVVAHGGVIRAILSDALAMPEDALFRLDQSHGGISIVDWLEDTAVVRLVNAQPTMVGRRRRGFFPAAAAIRNA